MNTIADKLRARAQEIRARMPGYEIYYSQGELAGLLCDDARFLEELADDLEADDLEADEKTVKEFYDEEIGELEDEVRDLEKDLEKAQTKIRELEEQNENHCTGCIGDGCGKTYHTEPSAK